MPNDAMTRKTGSLLSLTGSYVTLWLVEDFRTVLQLYTIPVLVPHSFLSKFPLAFLTKTTQLKHTGSTLFHITQSDLTFL